ncbi:hypothetical protein MSAN_01874100 [Mycena sanguinolenta]|uniref:Uncharacterized protein n=1 Tax=Mycena sanguinolenta TaxID=230812 RepID=A0A8H6XU53_9AGAR|nr:hypothetical protein MSAN_01874100 [Mycena sanguinolenta]
MSGFVIRRSRTGFRFIDSFLTPKTPGQRCTDHDLSFDSPTRFLTCPCSNINVVFLLPLIYLKHPPPLCSSSSMKFPHPCSASRGRKHVIRVPLARKALHSGMSPNFLRRRFTARKSRSTPEPSSRKPPNDDEEQTTTEEEPQPVNAKSQVAQTAANVLVFSLRTLSGISNSIPMVGALGGIIDTLLDIVGQVQQTSANEQSLAQLAARIERLTPIVTQMTEDDPPKGQGIVENLQKELASMTQQLKVAKTRGKLDQFFNSADNSSTLQMHNQALDQMIADATFLTVHEVAKSLRELENSKLQEPYPDITGGTGGDGGPGHTGGEGGEGEGPQVDMEPDEKASVGNISGGTGGTGGVGVAVGGKGGAGRGPVVNLRRIRV